MIKKINITTKERNYFIEIKANSINNKIRKIVIENNNTIFLIDKKVFHIFKKLKNYKKQKYIIINCSEKIKNFNYYTDLTHKILNKGVDRNSVLVAIGGGTLGDLSGFIASTVLRGIKLILIPTTLLSQVDSSVGGKNGINTIHGKNLIGTFYQPSAVFIDPNVLSSLPKREIKSGYVEIIKHSIINDEKFFKWLDNNSNKILNLNTKFLSEAIYRSILIKRKFVLKDEKEKLNNKYSRAILNFGHTFGHALETYYNYNKKLTHGEAISIGISIASTLSNKLNYLSNQNLNKITKHLKNNNLPIFDKVMYNRKIFNIIRKDKKNTGDTINLVLIKKIGSAFLNKKLSIENIKKKLTKN